MGLARFSDHLVVDEASLDGGSTAPVRVEWHAKLRGALTLIAEMSSAFESRVQHLPWYRDHDHRHATLAAEKHNLYAAIDRLDRTLIPFTAQRARLAAALTDASPRERLDATRALLVHQAVRFVSRLQDFHGRLVTGDRWLIHTLFPDLPRIPARLQLVPVRNPVTGLALWNEPWLVGARLTGADAGPDPIALPLAIAVRLHDAPRGSVDRQTYYRWLLPQLVLDRDDPPPALDQLAISALIDDDGEVKARRGSLSPWDFKLQREPRRYPRHAATRDHVAGDGWSVRALPLADPRPTCAYAQLPIVDAFPFPFELAAARALHELLMTLYPDERAAFALVERFGVDITTIAASLPVCERWRELLRRACIVGGTRALVAAVRAEHPRCSAGALLDELLAAPPPRVAVGVAS